MEVYNRKIETIVDELKQDGFLQIMLLEIFLEDLRVYREE